MKAYNNNDTSVGNINTSASFEIVRNRALLTVRRMSTTFANTIRTKQREPYLMSAVTVPASSVRVPTEAREALSQREPVTVVAHRRSKYVILHPEDYAVVSPLLERYRAGRPIPVDELLTEDDFAIIREESNAAPDDGILQFWLS